MAKLYITEYAAADINSAMEPPLVEQTVNIAGASAQSAAFNAETRLLRLHTDAICSVKFGRDPTATTSSRRMPANATEYVTVEAGIKVAVISNT